jgi:hypothetical protein
MRAATIGLMTSVEKSGRLIICQGDDPCHAGLGEDPFVVKIF